MMQPPQTAFSGLESAVPPHRSSPVKSKRSGGGFHSRSHSLFNYDLGLVPSDLQLESSAGVSYASRRGNNGSSTGNAAPTAAASAPSSPSGSSFVYKKSQSLRSSSALGGQPGQSRAQDIGKSSGGHSARTSLEVGTPPWHGARVSGQESVQEVSIPRYADSPSDRRSIESASSAGPSSSERASAPPSPLELDHAAESASRSSGNAILAEPGSSQQTQN